MGYGSDVLLAIAFESAEHRDEVWAIYCMDPRVQKHNLAAVWGKYDGGSNPVLWFESAYVKWYSNYEDVSGLEHLFDVADMFSNERGLRSGYIKYRLGEDVADIEEVSGGDSGMCSVLWEMARIERSITHDFCLG